MQEWLVRHGSAQGRRGAASVLDRLDFETTQSILLEGLDSEDEDVSAWATGELRPRHVPNAFRLLISRLGDTVGEGAGRREKPAPSLHDGACADDVPSVFRRHCVSGRRSWSERSTPAGTRSSSKRSTARSEGRSSMRFKPRPRWEWWRTFASRSSRCSPTRTPSSAGAVTGGAGLRTVGGTRRAHRTAPERLECPRPQQRRLGGGTDRGDAAGQCRGVGHAFGPDPPPE